MKNVASNWRMARISRDSHFDENADDVLTPVVDHRTLGFLQTMEESESATSFVDDLIEIFTKQTPQTLLELQTSICEHIDSVAQKLAHKIKGSSRNIGALRLAELCEYIEERSIMEYDDEIEKVVLDLEMRFLEAKEALLAIKGRRIQVDDR